MRRREFVALFGSAAVVWPLASRAQQRAASRLIAFLNSQSLRAFAPLLDGFRQGLSASGFEEGKNIQILYRWGEGNYERLPALAAELVDERPEVIVATGGEPSAIAAQRATSTIPVVFSIGGDPVQSGLVETIGRPGRNVTGVTLLTYQVEEKRVAILKEVVSDAKCIAALINPGTAGAWESQRAQFLLATKSIGVRPVVAYAKDESEFAHAFSIINNERADALTICADPYFNNKRRQLIELAAKYRIPAVHEFREFAQDGGLMSYGVDIIEIYRQVGDYKGRILLGAKPETLPVLQATRFKMAINLGVARTLGIQISDKLLGIADEVIE